ncbi:glycosyltransferase family 2 protein [Paeniroseomonas aquatica]|uniref:glycosyltransferase family 2 protein n=1 Tax=Paeniroseomonas aquatica TaxID=373043 RepID=UPI0036067710
MRRCPSAWRWWGRPGPRPGEVVGVVVARNEALRLGAALREVRRLGIGPVIVIDNLSTDETRAVAAGFDRVHLVEAPESYAGSGFGIAWINAVLDRWARGHWALMFDADEVLVFPGSDRPAALPRLCGHLDSLGSECLRVVMLDLFPQAPLARVAYRPEQSLPEAAAWFEPPRLRREAAPHFPFEAEYGGVRERLFFPEADPSRLLRRAYQRAYNLGWRLPWLRRSARFQALAPKRSPNMTKVPLVRWREGWDSSRRIRSRLWRWRRSSPAGCCCTSNSSRTSTPGCWMRWRGTRISTARRSTGATWRRCGGTRNSACTGRAACTTNRRTSSSASG